MADPSTKTVREIALDLAPALGEEKSVEVIAVTAQQLGLVEPFQPEAVTAILDWLARSPGLVGITARFVRSRESRRRKALQSIDSETTRPPTALRASTMRAQNLRASSSLSSSSTAAQPDSAPVSSAPTRIEVERIAELFAPSIGQEKGEDCIRGAMRELGLRDEALDLQQTLSVLEWLAGVGGIIAVTARFVKARVILLFSPPTRSPPESR